MEPVNTICICKKCGCIVTKNMTNPMELVCKKCQSTDFEDTRISPQAWGALSRDARKGRVRQVIGDPQVDYETAIYICKKCGCTATKKRKSTAVMQCKQCQSSEFYETFFSPDQWKALPEDKQKAFLYLATHEKKRKSPTIIEKLTETESQKHNMGCLLMLLGFLLCFTPAFMHGGTLPGVIFVIGFIMFVFGFFPWSRNRSASKIKEDNSMASAIVSSWGAKVKAGQSITGKDVDKAISAMGMDGAQKLEERKKVIAGAVAGGIVAGEVGAVAGAVAAKAKIEEDKLNK